MILIIIGSCLSNSPVAASQLQNKKLAASNYTIYGLPLDQARLTDFFSKLGPTIVFEDDTNPKVRCICYISDRDETLVLVKSVNYRLTRYKLMSRKMRFYKWHFCEKSPLVSDNLSIQNGIKLGMHKARIKAIIGNPREETHSQLRYDYRWKENIGNHPAAEVNRNSEVPRNEPFRTVTVNIIAEFSDSKLVDLDIMIDSDTPGNP